ncbi:hypothetical protein PN498_25535 [Oscillatoria sp. CS-180]|uniref:hypothetical protein n=1 Tax=Oscillatoria sp. CS-180 TaxID=3021720 RepID=UPI00232F23BF|nr:hypothetical protein [Oscillatoria sp. CS-180]MDB9529379.1 hypothetical protein [Oscillatoria sp. CS-180]
MPAKGEIEISIKFKGIPLVKSDSRGGTRLEVYSDGYVVLADVKTRTYKRFVGKTMEYDYWEGIIHGKLKYIQGHQLILDHAGIQCYERKAKSGAASD